MLVRGRELLTPEERNELMGIRPDMSEWELATYYTFSKHDIEIINRHRRNHNRLGFAVQLCTLRYPGWSLSDVKDIPERYIAKQIDVDPEVYPLYAQRDPTRREHLEEIRQEYGYRNFSSREYRSSSQFLLHHAMENGNPTHLIRTVLDKLRKRKIILPAMTTIERLVWETRHRAEERIFKQLTNSLSTWQKLRLDKLIDPFECLG